MSKVRNYVTAMARKSKVRAWDSIWDDLQNITHLGWPEEPDEKREELITIINKIYNSQLKTELAYSIGDAIKLAYEIGKRER